MQNNNSKMIAFKFLFMSTKEKEVTNQFEKMVFLELTNKQFSKIPNSEYYETYQKLNQEEKKLIDTEISNEIHKIWTYINTTKLDDAEHIKITSIKEYNDFINPVNEIILKISNEFNITLKKELSKQFIQAIKEFLDRFLKSTNQR